MHFYRHPLPFVSYMVEFCAQTQTIPCFPCSVVILSAVMKHVNTMGTLDVRDAINWKIGLG